MTQRGREAAWSFVISDTAAAGRGDAAIEEPYGYRTSQQQQQQQPSSSAAAATPSPEAREQTRATLLQLKQKKAWEAARAPLSGLLMTALMLWMAGSTVHFFAIMMVAMSIFNSAKGLFAVGAVFRPFADLPWAALLAPRLCYVAVYCLHLGAGAFKLHTLGLLPTTSSDWHSILPLKSVCPLSSAKKPPVYKPHALTLFPRQASLRLAAQLTSERRAGEQPNFSFFSQAFHTIFLIY